MKAHRILLTILMIVFYGMATAEDFNWSGSANAGHWYAFNSVPDSDDPVVWVNNWGEVHYQYPGQDPPGPSSWNWPSGPDTANIDMAGAELFTGSAALSGLSVGLGGSIWIRNTLQCTTFNIAGLVEVGANAEIYDCAIQNDGGTGILRSEFYFNYVVPDPVLRDVIISVPVEIPNDKALALLGNVQLNDVIELLSTGSAAHLVIDGDATLAGNGRVETSDNAGNTIAGNQYYGQVFTNQVTIHAAGQLGYGNLSITNEGLIVADRTTMLIVDPEDTTGDGHPGFINTSTLRAADGGTLRLERGTFDNTGGVIEALDASVVELHDNVFVTGGSLKTLGTGEIRAIGNDPRVKDLTVDAGSALVIPEGKHLHPEGTVTINGELRLQSTGGASTLMIRSPVFLAGTGEVVLSDNDGNAFSYVWHSANNRLTSSIPIRGATGSVYGLAHGIAITNQSTITADGVNPMLINPSTAPLDGQAGVVNTGTLRAVDGATLQLVGGSFDNTSGIIAAQDGSTVELQSGVVLAGGTLRTTGTGILRSTTSYVPPLLRDLTSNGRLEALGGPQLKLGGTCRARHCACVSIWQQCSMSTMSSRAMLEEVVADVLSSLRGLARAKLSSLNARRNWQSGFARLRRDGLRSFPQGSRTKTGGRCSLEQRGRRPFGSIPSRPRCSCDAGMTAPQHPKRPLTGKRSWLPPSFLSAGGTPAPTRTVVSAGGMVGALCLA